MNQISNQQLLNFNQIGLIPGPNESEDEFLLRANYCLSLKEHLSAEFKAHLGAMSDDSLCSKDKLSEGFDVVALRYNILPNWIPIFFSNYQLPFWNGGCAWIFQMTESSPTAALLQLRQSLYKQPKYLGIYSRNELVAHELTHVGRMKFDEPKFEEIIAYRTSYSAFRRYFGPIVQSSWESMLFVLALMMIVFIDVFMLVFNSYEAYLSTMWLKIIPAGMIFLALIRLYLRQHTFNKCIKALKGCLKDLNKAQWVVYRLTDREIIEFSGMESHEIMKYVSDQAQSSLRWQLIHLAYFKD